jgi:hypothetical protein
MTIALALLIAVERTNLPRSLKFDMARGLDRLASKPDVPPDIAERYRAEAERIRASLRVDA